MILVNTTYEVVLPFSVSILTEQEALEPLVYTKGRCYDLDSLKTFDHPGLSHLPGVPHVHPGLPGAPLWQVPMGWPGPCMPMMLGGMPFGHWPGKGGARSADGVGSDSCTMARWSSSWSTSTTNPPEAWTR